MSFVNVCFLGEFPIIHLQIDWSFICLWSVLPHLCFTNQWIVINPLICKNFRLQKLFILIQTQRYVIERTNLFFSPHKLVFSTVRDNVLQSGANYLTTKLKENYKMLFFSCNGLLRADRIICKSQIFKVTFHQYDAFPHVFSYK